MSEHAHLACNWACLMLFDGRVRSRARYVNCFCWADGRNHATLQIISNELKEKEVRRRLALSFSIR